MEGLKSVGGERKINETFHVRLHFPLDAHDEFFSSSIFCNVELQNDERAQSSANMENLVHSFE